MTPASPGPALISLYYCLLTFLLSPATTRHLPQNRRSSPSPPPAPCAGRQPAGEGRRRADPFPSLPPRDLFLLSPVLGPTTTTTVINKSAGRQAGTRRRRAVRGVRVLLPPVAFVLRAPGFKKPPPRQPVCSTPQHRSRPPARLAAAAFHFPFASPRYHHKRRAGLRVVRPDSFPGPAVQPRARLDFARRRKASALRGGVAPPPTGGFCFFSFQLGGKDAPPADRALHGGEFLSSIS